MIFIMTRVCVVLLSFTLLSCTSRNVIRIHAVDNPQVAFALSELSQVLEEADQKFVFEKTSEQSKADILILIDTNLPKEGYEISGNHGKFQIKGADANGAMYATLEFAEHLKIKGLDVSIDVKSQPYIENRGIKFNIPLDVRTPSYDDTGDAAQNNIGTVWEFDFWQNFLDNMARNRYNLLTLWSDHPYPSWVKLEKYPEVALEDVYRYGGLLTSETNMKWKDAEVESNLQLVKKMTMDEKIAFWQKVFQYAADRGIAIHLFHWNVFVYGAEGKHGITWEQDNPITIDYIKESVKEMLLIYPNIKGIGVTAGEHIDRKLTGDYKTENWMWLTYGKAIMEAKAEKSELDVRFIFRRHWSDLDDIREAFKDFDGEIETSFKYSRARMYSSVAPPWFDKIYRDEVEAQNVKCWLNVRNDDFFTFRWGDPEYASAYIKNMPRELSPGFYMGPDGYVWGKEFISKNPTAPRQFEIEKHWYRFMIWGRTAYNPDLPKSFFVDQLKKRFPETDADLMYDTWKLTSKVIGLVDQFHFRQNDAQFSLEGSFDKTNFHDINSFISLPPMPEQRVLSIPEYLAGGNQENAINPLEVGNYLLLAGEELLGKSKELLDEHSNWELRETVGDLEAWGYLSNYYGYKIQSALSLAKFRLDGGENEKANSWMLMKKSLEAWENYARVATSQYEPQLYARTQLLDWNALIDSVKKDLRIIEQAKQGESVELNGDNYLWNRDARKF